MVFLEVVGDILQKKKSKWKPKKKLWYRCSCLINPQSVHTSYCKESWLPHKIHFILKKCKLRSNKSDLVYNFRVKVGGRRLLFIARTNRR